MTEFSDSGADFEKKFYSKSTLHQNFNNITEETIDRIDSIVSKFIKYNEDLISNKYNSLYCKALEFLLDKNSTTDLPTYDEKLIFLIRIIDPECTMYKLYLNIDTKNVSKLSSYIFKNFGIFSMDLLQYEKTYTNKFNKTLLTGINQNNDSYLNLLTSLVKKFDTNIERFNEIQMIADKWKKLPDTNYRTCIYNILYQHNILTLNTLEEQLIFFINCIDPNLNLLQIYEEECNITNIEKRSKEEFGFYAPKIFQLEKIYHDTYVPDTKTSDWTLFKK